MTDNCPSFPPQNTLKEILTRIEELLAERGTASPVVEARLLCAHLLSLPRPTDLLFHLQHPLTPELSRKLSQLVSERLSGKPLQLIVGSVDFHSVTLRMNAGVFIPRPETETLVEVGLEFLGSLSGGEPVKVLDLGTGCGAVLIALACRTGFGGVGTDISPIALALAEENAGRNQVGNLLEFRKGDLYSALPPSARKFSLIVSNPPYILSSQIPTLPPEVRDYDPRESIDGGEDGLGMVRRIVEEAPGHLQEGGMLAVEMGEGQAEEEVMMFSEAGFEAVEVEPDLAGRERVVSGILPGS